MSITKEQRRIYSRKYYIKNRVIVNARCRKYNHKNKDKVKKWFKTWLSKGANRKLHNKRNLECYYKRMEKQCGTNTKNNSEKKS